MIQCDLYKSYRSVEELVFSEEVQLPIFVPVLFEGMHLVTQQSYHGNREWRVYAS